MAMEPAEDTVRRIGRYEIVRKIATGGMAELYLGKFTGPGGFEKRCALKRVLPQFAADPTFQRMFETEARVSAMFDHPNVVQVFELGKDDAGQYFIAMEMVNGMNLRQLIHMARERGQHIPPELAAFMVTQALDGLAYAHAFRHPETGEPLNLVHRDISPQNILVSFEGAVKLVDFGIVKGSSISGETITGMLKGKVAYMSPEQASGEPLDGRSDLFSLGVCFYELVSQQRPFRGNTDVMMLKSILDDPPVPLTDHIPDLAEGIEHSIYRALEKYPENRYASARAFQVELQQVLRDCPVPPSRHLVADYIRALTETETLQFDATQLKIPRGLRAVPAGFAVGGIDPSQAVHQGSGAHAPADPTAQGAGSASPLPGPALSTPAQPMLGAQQPWSTPPPGPAPAESHTPRPLDESIGGTSEMLRQAGLSGHRRRRGGGLMLALAALVALVATGLWIRSQDTVIIGEPLPSGRLVDVPEPTPLELPEVAAAAVAAPKAEPEEAARPDAGPAEAVAAPEAVEPAPPPPPKTPKKRRRRRRRARKVAAPAPTGRLVVTTEPAGLTVYGNGERIGRTPLDARVAPGAYALRVKSAALGIDAELSADVPKGGRADRSLTLKKGSLQVVSRPWATVFVNGAKKGTTPLEVRVYEGRQTVKLVTEAGAERIQRVTVKPGERSTVRVKF